MDTLDILKVKGHISFKIIGVDGKIRDKWELDNLIVSVGKAAIAGLVGNTGGVSAFTYLALGTSNTAPSVGQTALGSEISSNGLSRASATVSRVTTNVTNDTLQLFYTWNVSGSQTVEEVGVFNAASSGIMLGRALTLTKNLVNGEQFMITYKIAFS